MDTREMDEDAVDLQDLQAQIDLSMSFAQNLVSSWVKGTRYSQTTRQRDLENDVKEYMRRPARLGVGAPIPETQSLGREAAMLKHKLESGKKQQREDEYQVSKRPHSDDLDGSRAEAIKKKSRLDPFGATLTKKQRKSAELNGTAMHPAAMQALLQCKPTFGHAENRLETGKSTPELFTSLESSEAPRQMMGKKEEDPSNLSCDNIDQRKAKSPEYILQSINENTITGSSRFQEPTTVKHSCNPPPTTPKATQQPLTATPANTRELADESLTETSLLSPGHHASSVELFKQSLLNLDGSSGEESEKDEKTCVLPSTPKKKKRKRRKKKKSQQNTEVLLAHSGEVPVGSVDNTPPHNLQYTFQ